MSAEDLPAQANKEEEEVMAAGFKPLLAAVREPCCACMHCRMPRTLTMCGWQQLWRSAVSAARARAAALQRMHARSHAAAHHTHMEVHCPGSDAPADSGTQPSGILCSPIPSPIPKQGTGMGTRKPARYNFKTGRCAHHKASIDANTRACRQRCL